MASSPSVPPSEFAESEIPMSEMGETSPMMPTSFPPYPPYATEPPTPSVAETIHAGRDLRIQHKSTAKKPAHPPPKPARPRGPKATDVKLSRRATRAHARCLRKHGAVLTERLERMAKPLRRNIIYLWREHANTLPPETITRLRCMLDADEPFKPDQAYEYFININKTKKKAIAKARVNAIKKDVVAMYADKRYVWARNATIAFARGIQQRLSRPGRYALADGMQRLSNIVLNEVCGFMHMKTPSPRCAHPKARYMKEVSDKVAIWIDEIISESDDRMLMMDFDEDDEVFGANDGFADDFLNMMAGDELYNGPQSAYLKFTGEMLEAFTILTESMDNKGDQQLLSLEKFNQTYAEGADELRRAPDFHATEFNTQLVFKIKVDLEATVQSKTPSKIQPFMKGTRSYTVAAQRETRDSLGRHMTDMVELCSNYLAQHAEFSKHKGPAFKLLLKTMKAKGNAPLYKMGKAKRTYTKACQELEESKGLQTDHDDPNLSQQIHGSLTKLVENVTTPPLKNDMTEILDMASKYLSQNAVDETERGPAFGILIKELEKYGAEDFTPEHVELKSKFAAAYTLKSAPGFTSISPDPNLAPKFEDVLHKIVDAATPKNLKTDMDGVIQRCAGYLSGFIRDREKAYKMLLAMMKSNPKSIIAQRNNYAMDYGTGAAEVEAAPNLIPFLPIKDIVDEAEANLSRDIQATTPPELIVAMKTMVRDVAKYLSQSIALRSGAAGERYGINFLAAIKDSLGTKKLYKYKVYGQTYADAADELKHAGPLDVNMKDKSTVNLHHNINMEMKRGVPGQLAPTVAEHLDDTMTDAAKHLAIVGVRKGNALNYLVDLMKKQGDVPLGVLQGYEQTYNDGARRIENAPTLTNEKVHKGTYDNVRDKLTTLTTNAPSTEHSKYLPGLVDDTSKFLSAPVPEDEADKRRVLADLMARKGDATLDKEGIYKMTHTEGADELRNAPVGVTTAQDEKKKKAIESKLYDVIPNTKMQDLLKGPVKEGAAHLADVMTGRGEAMQKIHDGMKKEKDKELINIGKFKKSHEEGADMLNTASHFGGQDPAPIILDKVAERVSAIPKEGVSGLALLHMKDASDITSKYIAGVATGECGLDAKALGEMDAASRGLDAKALGEMDAASRGLDAKALGEMDAASRGLDAKALGEINAASRGLDAKALGEIDAASRAAGRAIAEDVHRKLEGKAKAESSPRVESRPRLESTPRLAEKEADAARAGQADLGEEERRRSMRAQDGEADAARAGQADLDEEERRRSMRAQDGEFDPEWEEAMGILHKVLRSHGNEVFYEQPHTELTHKIASDWIKVKPRKKVDKTVKESVDTARLHKKFEKKLGSLVYKATQPSMYDTMQDAVIESSRILSEYFVSESYKAQVHEALISEMQKRGNEILIEVDGAAETFFYAAQRLKKAKNLDVKDPCSQVAFYLTKNMEDMIRCRSMARKLSASMKEHIKVAADYLSIHVTKSGDKILDVWCMYMVNRMIGTLSRLLIVIDSMIEAYVTLLGEMESAGDTVFIESGTPKSYQEAAACLRQMTSFEDQIKRPNSTLQASIEGKLKQKMANVTPSGYSTSDMHGIITDSTKLLVSYISHQDAKTEVLKLLIVEMDQVGENVLLRHGNIRKVYKQGADILRGKNTDQLKVPSGDPVVTRKIQIKLKNLMYRCKPANVPELLLEDVIEDATMYLAVQLLQPQIIQVCKCMKNVFVQCELWCEEILRRVARPCCTCSRYVSTQALSDLVPTAGLRISPGCSRGFAPGLEISFKKCSNQLNSKTCEDPETMCSAAKKALEHNKPTTSQCKHPTTYNQNPITMWMMQHTLSNPESLTPTKTNNTQHKCKSELSSTVSYNTPLSSSLPEQVLQSPTAMYMKEYTQDINAPPELETKIETATNNRPVATDSRSSRPSPSTCAPIISMDQMSDWHAMLVSLMWNLQAWRDWIQENIDQALAYEHKSDNSPAQVEERWATFQKRVTTEALQWRQYNIFSRQLTMRLGLRYQNKRIVSPTRATIKTKDYLECQEEMLDIIYMFSRWTHWLILVVKETDSIRQTPDSSMPLHELRWNHFKESIQIYSEDWKNYNNHLKVSWEQKYKTLITDWLPDWKESAPVWVVSACGTVPSGAVSAGVFEGEVVWVARTTHKGNVLPAALHPSKHCCLVYADEAVHYYTKYQVMCNAEVSWVAWRAGNVGVRAVRVSPGVYVGRVIYRGSHLVGAVHAPSYRCQVVIFDRAFAFNCYELLVLSEDDESS